MIGKNSTFIDTNGEENTSLGKEDTTKSSTDDREKLDVYRHQRRGEYFFGLNTGKLALCHEYIDLIVGNSFGLNTGKS